jgi:single-stranded DNA-binding protein
MNNCQFAGVITESAELEKTKSGLSKCDFKLKVGKGGSDKEFEVPLQAWAQVAEKFTPSLKVGTKVLISASYEPHSYESKYKQGQINTIHKFTAKDILLLSKPTSSFNPDDIDLPF